MIPSQAITEAERYVLRLERVVASLCRLHGFSEAEAMVFIEQMEQHREPSPNESRARDDQQAAA